MKIHEVSKRTLLEKALDIQSDAELIMSSAEFKNWFTGSKVSKNGLPLICYHGTGADFSSKEFRPFTHFGTVGAATTRLMHVLTKNTKKRIIPVFLSIKAPEILEDNEDVEHDLDTFLTLYTFSLNDFYEIFDEDLVSRNAFNEFLKKYYKGKREMVDRTEASYIIFNLVKDGLIKGISGEPKTLAEALIECLVGQNKYEGKISIPEFLNIYTKSDDAKKSFILSVMEKHGKDGWYYKNDVEDKGSTSWIITDPSQVWPIGNY